MRWVYSTEELSRLIAQDRVRLGERATRPAVCLVDRCSKRLYPQDGTAARCWFARSAAGGTRPGGMMPVWCAGRAR